ncbi:MAG TPA: tRNA (adenosine(37)-N6)-threonylcarbamoyltransferase complex dimerization subunit type 1 TsaB [Bryobacteraceae bacterium]|jgi:tRNA threonylcarbamoyladenosine biosynthesis protein TsaB|nr:tRNA (adenosine(37)-N6)-threonylcarbamoyltransferase complex dimerization subunit type 1 TsaB [Bryobacteraceae bacterium]
MLTLAVDTTADAGSIALADDNGFGEEIIVEAPRGFSRVLFGEIEQLLARQRVKLAEIDLFAAAAGPGSFTGVRVGLSAMKGLAEVLRKPIAAVSNLAALAEFGDSDLRATIIDARRGEVYGAVYDHGGRLIIPEVVLPFEKFPGLLPSANIEWIAQDFEPFRAALAGTQFESRPVVKAPAALADAVARIAMRRAAAGLATDPATIEANYVRRSDAELLFKAG